jgi:hypothetical protein
MSADTIPTVCGARELLRIGSRLNGGHFYRSELDALRFFAFTGVFICSFPRTDPIALGIRFAVMVRKRHAS